MIEAGLVLGATITFPTTTSFSVGRSINNPEEKSLGVQKLTLKLSVPDYATTRDVTYLPYSGGRINYAHATGDVLSGFFTGCIMSVYIKDGVRTVAHVHTGTDAGSMSDCKALMKRRLNSHGYISIKNFKPFIEDKYMEIYLKQKIADPTHLRVLGLVAHDNRCYSVFVRRDSEFVWRVEGRFDRSAHPYVFE